MSTSTKDHSTSSQPIVPYTHVHASPTVNSIDNIIADFTADWRSQVFHLRQNCNAFNFNSFPLTTLQPMIFLLQHFSWSLHVSLVHDPSRQAITWRYSAKPLHQAATISSCRNPTKTLSPSSHGMFTLDLAISHRWRFHWISA
jgi:hypothetical protein